MSTSLDILDSALAILEKNNVQNKDSSKSKQSSKKEKNNKKQQQQQQQQQQQHLEQDEKESKNISEYESKIDTTRKPGTAPNPKNEMNIDDRVKLAISVGEECQEPSELQQLFEKKPTRPVAYDGFEPSGRMHIAQGILKSICVNKLTECGVDFVFWVADWFALLNNKMDGDLNKIRTVGEYMVEIWKAAGMNMDHVYFKWASDEINANANDYWLRVIEVSKSFSITRTKRCCTIMGREESDEMPTAHLLYACMQCADIFFLKADICQLGLDQKKVNMLAREYAKKKKLRSPVVISHHMLAGLKEGQEKMSKSDPDSAIFMEDTIEDVERKIKKAFCPPTIVKGNPCLDYTKHIVFGKYKSFTIKRDAKNNGDITYNSYEELEKDFVDDKLHPTDLKKALSAAINSMLEPVRQHFQNDPHAKSLLERVKKFKITK